MWRVVAMTFLALPAIASAASIGVFFSPDGQACDTEATQFVPFHMYLAVVLGAPGPVECMGAEFRVRGHDPSWLGVVTPNPAASVVVGNPLAEGCNIVFPACQAGSFLSLYTIEFIPLTPVPPTRIVIDHRDPPSGPSFSCPLLYACEPFLAKACVQGGEGFVNLPTGCNVGTAVMTWSSVKRLYD